MKGLFKLPVGYCIGGGTSCAAPTAAGAVALLISAARQNKIPHDAVRIHKALTSSARYLQNIAAHKQGAGLIQVADAWKMLKSMPPEEKPITITSRAPVKTVFSQWLSPANTGPGIYERGGWTAGQKGERKVTFTRHSGPSSPMDFQIQWQGNDGSWVWAVSCLSPKHDGDDDTFVTRYCRYFENGKSPEWINVHYL